MVSTAYGKKSVGTSRFVIVAPHAGGDDSKTGELAARIAKRLNASLVVNERYIKRSNSRAQDHPEIVEDFNRLSYSRRRRAYVWGRKRPQMRQFYNHISEMCDNVRESGYENAVVIYIHGMRDKGKKGIDIGFGAKPLLSFGSLRGAIGRFKHPKAGSNTGVVRARRLDMKSLKSRLDNSLVQDHGLSAGIGRFAAWSRRNGIQYHSVTRNSSDPKDHSFQLEIAKRLRTDENIEYTADLIADALREVYEQSV